MGIHVNPLIFRENQFLLQHVRVILPTLRSFATRIAMSAALLAFFSGCSTMDSRWGESCKSHAYVRMVLHDFVSSRFSSQAPVRLAVIPFSVPANLSAYSTERPGLGNQLAWQIQASLLQVSEIPIVEVLNRHDWPGKKDEFFTGNFGAIQTAREAGYDLVLIGFLEPMTDGDAMSASTKLIDTHSGVTVWYGRSSALTRRPMFNEIRARLSLENRVPSELHYPQLVHELGKCVVRGILEDRPTG